MSESSQQWCIPADFTQFLLTNRDDASQSVQGEKECLIVDITTAFMHAFIAELVKVKVPPNIASRTCYWKSLEGPEQHANGRTMPDCGLGCLGFEKTSMSIRCRKFFGERHG